MDLLEKWDLGHLIGSFIEQNIDSIEIFKGINDSDLKELIPTLGDRIKFKLKLQEHLNETANIPDMPIILQFANIDDENVEPPLKKICSEETSTPSISSYSDVSLNNSTDHTEVVVLKTNDILNFNLKHLLENHLVGRAILMKYEQQGSLDSKDRNSLCEIIVCHFLNEGKRLNNACISILADKIVSIFEKELKSTYYISPIPKRRSKANKPQVAKGKLVDKHRNKLTMIRKTLNFGSSENSKATSSKSDVSQNIIDSKIWLKNNIGPDEDVLRHWKNSFELRKKVASDHDFFREWPILETQIAIQLIEYDYQEKYHEIDNGILSESLGKLFENVLEKRQHLLKPSDEIIKQQLTGEITYDSQVAIQLYLLAGLVPPKGRIPIGGKKNWKPSSSESRDSLFLQAREPGDIEKLKKERLDLIFSKGLTVQPYLMLVGPSLNNITASYVIINNINYKTNSVLEALKFCFKACIVLDLNYPPECQHLWYLFQWVLFKIKNPNDLKIPYISDILDL